MIVPGHVGITLLLYAPIAYVLARHDRKKTMTVGLVAVLAFGLVPDLDVFVPGLAHRGVTHSIGAAVGLGLAAGTVGLMSGSVVRIRRLSRLGLGFLAGCLGVVGHLVGDVITPMGIAPFYPVSSTSYTLGIVSARDPVANLALFGAGVVVLRLALEWADVRRVPPEHAGENQPADSDTISR